MSKCCQQRKLEVKSCFSYGVLLFSVVISGCMTFNATVPSDWVVREPLSKAYETDNQQELIDFGKTLWWDKTLSPVGKSCASCHSGGEAFQASFADPFPHRVEMASDLAKLESVTAEEMVQLCMLASMESKPLPWDSKELAALALYIVSVEQPIFVGQ